MEPPRDSILGGLASARPPRRVPLPHFLIVIGEHWGNAAPQIFASRLPIRSSRPSSQSRFRVPRLHFFTTTKEAPLSKYSTTSSLDTSFLIQSNFIKQPHKITMSDSEDHVDPIDDAGDDDLFGDDDDDANDAASPQGNVLSDGDLASDDEDDRRAGRDDRAASQEEAEFKDKTVLNVPLYRHRIPKSTDDSVGPSITIAIPSRNHC